MFIVIILLIIINSDIVIYAMKNVKDKFLVIIEIINVIIIIIKVLREGRYYPPIFIRVLPTST